MSDYDYPPDRIRPSRWLVLVYIEEFCRSHHRYPKVLEIARAGAVTGKIRLLYRVSCGLCSASTETCARRESAAAKVFRDLGWSKSVKHGWICAACVAERKSRVR